MPFSDQCNPRNSIGSSKERNNTIVQPNNSKYKVQIQNGSVNEINEAESPEKLNTNMMKSNERGSSAAQPININLGSNTRFSN